MFVCIFFITLFIQALSTVIIPPYYNFSSLYRDPPVPENANVTYLVQREFIRHHQLGCLTDTQNSKHSVNKARHISDIAEAISAPNFLNGTTYWLNEYMHVGHITFDIVLMQLLKGTKIDRVIMQRAACNGNLCAGIGTFRSFYSAYFAAIVTAFQPGIPFYMRFTWHQKAVSPVFVSLNISGYEINDEDLSPEQKATQPILLHGQMCFEQVIRRGPTNHGNYYGSVAPEVIHQFKETAYRSTNIAATHTNTPLTTYFRRDAPYVILFSYRGNSSTRYYDNNMDMLHMLETVFLKPVYEVRSFNNANSSLTAEIQIEAVASANVVLTNHGAFEGNLIYMRNASLLIELSGNYYNPEFRFFMHFAQMFGVYYSRIQTDLLLDHGQSGNATIQNSEIDEVVNTIKHYFDEKPFLHNVK